MNKPNKPDVLPLNPLTALSPLDGRYQTKTAELRPLFSEYGLIRHRVLVEIRWLVALGDHKKIKEVAPFSPAARKLLDAIIPDFSETDARRVKEIEATTNHDVKAIEYFLKEKTRDNTQIAASSELFYFPSTSEATNTSTS